MESNFSAQQIPGNFFQVSCGSLLGQIGVKKVQSNLSDPFLIHKIEPKILFTLCMGNLFLIHFQPKRFSDSLHKWSKNCCESNKEWIKNGPEDMTHVT